MTGYQIAMLGLMIAGTVIIPLGAWILRLQNRVLVAEQNITHIDGQKNDLVERLERVEETLSSIDKNLASLVAVLRSKGVVNGSPVIGE